MENGTHTAKMAEGAIGTPCWLAQTMREREREREIDYWRLFRESTWDNSISHPWGHPQSPSNILSPVVVSSVETKTPFSIIPRALHG